MKRVDHQSILADRFAEQHNQQILAAVSGPSSWKNLACHHDSHVLTVDLKYWRFSSEWSLSRATRMHPVDSVVRECVGLARDVHDDRAEHRKRYRELDLKARPLARLRLNVEAAADRPDHRVNDVESDAAAGNFGHLRRRWRIRGGRGSPGVRRRSAFGPGQGWQVPVRRLCREAVPDDSPAIVGDGNREQTRTCAASMRSRPISGFPTACRSSGVSSPWSSALRTR